MTRAVDKKYVPSAELYCIVKTKKATRGEFLKKIWEYADRNDLKTTKKVKGRNMGAIECDDALYDVFEKDIVSAPEVMKGLSQHLEDA
jgi:chromatin remodeling complex protein RSC6